MYRLSSIYIVLTDGLHSPDSICNLDSFQQIFARFELDNNVNDFFHSDLKYKADARISFVSDSTGESNNSGIWPFVLAMIVSVSTDSTS